jgi:hypothetical protein
MVHEESSNTGAGAATARRVVACSGGTGLQWCSTCAGRRRTGCSYPNGERAGVGTGEWQRQAGSGKHTCVAGGAQLQRPRAFEMQ